MMKACLSRPDRLPQEGDELWFGLVGPIRVSDEVAPERQAWIEAGRIAQAAHSLADLAGLVASHPDPQVSYQAMPRLRARFPNERRTLDVLVAAAEHPNPPGSDSESTGSAGAIGPASVRTLWTVACSGQLSWPPASSY